MNAAAAALPLLMPEWPGQPAQAGVLATVRAGGVSLAPYDDGTGGGGFNLATHVGDDAGAVARNRARVRALLPAEPAWLNQVHGTTVVDAAQVVAGAPAPDADASIAAAPGVVCAIMTADCLPVLFCDAPGRVVGAAHAGWRGLAGGVLEDTVAAMRAAGAGDILAWLGPAIGPDSFEVGEDVRQAFAGAHAEAGAAFVPNLKTSGKYFADIYHLARLALQRAGVARVAGGGLCTVRDTGRFYSYRRDGRTGRMAAMIWLRG